MKDLDFLEDGYGEFLDLAKATNLAVQQVLKKNFEGRLKPDDLFHLCVLLDVLNDKVEKLNQEIFSYGEKLTLKEVA